MKGAKPLAPRRIQLASPQITTLPPYQIYRFGLLRSVVGNQGALRSAFLLKAGLSKEAFVATGGSAVIVDAVRLMVYGTTMLAGQFSKTHTLAPPVVVGTRACGSYPSRMSINSRLFAFIALGRDLSKSAPLLSTDCGDYFLNLEWSWRQAQSD